jgi:hypothetical protein
VAFAVVEADTEVAAAAAVADGGAADVVECAAVGAEAPAVAGDGDGLSAKSMHFHLPRSTGSEESILTTLNLSLGP